MRERLLRSATVVVLLAAEAAAVALALRAGSDDPVDWAHLPRWIAAASPDTVCLEAGRLVVLAVGTWLLATTLGAVGSGLWGACTRRPARAGVVARCAPVVVRRLVEGVFAAGIVAGTLTPVAPLGPVRDGRTPTTASAVSTPAPTAPSAAPTAPSASTAAVAPVSTTSPAATPSSAAPATQPSPSTTATARVVIPGENLWSIAHDEVLAATGRADLPTVAGYWQTLCDANRARVRSGDVNRIAPGETLDLPPVA